MKISGTQIAYCVICPTKLWYFSRQIAMERSSDLVAIGKFIHENSYSREKKEIRIGRISIDFIKTKDGIELHEVKKSKKMEHAHVLQTRYYLHVLKQRGIAARAVIDYPTIRERVSVELDEAGELEVAEAIRKVELINALSQPPEPERKRYCPKCSYYELCWSE